MSPDLAAGCESRTSECATTTMTMMTMMTMPSVSWFVRWYGLLALALVITDGLIDVKGR